MGTTDVWVYVQHDRDIVDRFAPGSTFEWVDAACVDYLRAWSPSASVT